MHGIAVIVYLGKDEAVAVLPTEQEIAKID
jgi:hypothetical protein